MTGNSYTEERQIIQVGNSIGTTLNQKCLKMLDLKLGDRVQLRYDSVLKEIIIYGV